MPGLSVDGSGNITGTIELKDADLLAGKHEIEIIGSQGTVVKGLYVNDPSASLTDLRQVFVSGTTDSFAPIAQTFSVDEERDLIAIELDIDKNTGTDDVVVQIREVENGFPAGDKILAESRVEAANINALGTYTRFNLNPIVPLLTDREYAIMVITNDITYTIAVAELGGVDIVSGNAVAKQPNAGVLLTSSNGSSWSVEQSKDLKFKLIGATYATTTKEVDLGNLTGTNISDFLIFAKGEISDKDSQIKFKVTDPDSAVYTVDKDQRTILASKKTGTFNVKAVLTGSTKKSPILFPNTELILGEINATGNYFSKKFKVPDTFGIKVIIDAKTTASGNYTPAIEDTVADTYTNLTLVSSETLPDGYVRTVWSAAGITEVGTSNLSSIKIVANCPTVASRIYMRNLMAFTE